MTYTEADMRRAMNEAYRAGVEEGIRRAREGGNIERTVRPRRHDRTPTRTPV